MKKSIMSSILDEMIVFIFSVIGLGIFELILRIIGFTMVTPSIFLLGIFFIANVLYYPIIENSKYNTTIGMRILKLDEVKDSEVVEENETIEEDNEKTEEVVENSTDSVESDSEEKEAIKSEEKA